MKDFVLKTTNIYDYGFLSQNQATVDCLRSAEFLFFYKVDGFYDFLELLETSFEKTGVLLLTIKYNNMHFSFINKKTGFVYSSKSVGTLKKNLSVRYTKKDTKFNLGSVVAYDEASYQGSAVAEAAGKPIEQKFDFANARSRSAYIMKAACNTFKAHLFENKLHFLKDLFFLEISLKGYIPHLYTSFYYAMIKAWLVPTNSANLAPYFFFENIFKVFHYYANSLQNTSQSAFFSANPASKLRSLMKKVNNTFFFYPAHKQVTITPKMRKDHLVDVHDNVRLITNTDFFLIPLQIYSGVQIPYNYNNQATYRYRKRKRKRLKFIYTR